MHVGSIAGSKYWFQELFEAVQNSHENLLRLKNLHV
jgi:hypothetical protein